MCNFIGRVQSISRAMSIDNAEFDNIWHLNNFSPLLFSSLVYINNTIYSFSLYSVATVDILAAGLDFLFSVFSWKGQICIVIRLLLHIIRHIAVLETETKFHGLNYSVDSKIQNVQHKIPGCIAVICIRARGWQVIFRHHIHIFLFQVAENHWSS